VWYEGKIREPLLQGSKVKLGSQEFIATITPAVLLDIVKQAQRAREAAERGDLATQLSVLFDLVVLILAPNYPDVTTELVSAHGTLTELALVVTTAVKAAAVQPTLPGYMQKRNARTLN
jgi:hypothetical protein